MQLVEFLAYSGARKSNGAVVASGRCWFYQTGSGTTLAIIYADADGTATQVNPVTLDAAGRAVVYVKEQVRILIEDVNHLPIVDQSDAGVIRSELVEVESEGFTGVDPDTGGQIAGGRTDLAAVLESAFESFGGVDFKYLESGGATPRTIHDKFSEISISVKDFGAVGDGVAIDTTAIQAAINRVGSLGGGIVLLPPGDFKTDVALTSSSSTGVILRGAGRGATRIKNSNATGNVFTFTSCTSFAVEDLSITTSSGTSTGTAVSLSSCTNFRLVGVSIANHLMCLGVAGASQQVYIYGNSSLTSSGGATGRAIKYYGTSFGLIVTGAFLSGGTSGTTVEFADTAGTSVIQGATFLSGPSVGVLWSGTGTGFTVTGCHGLSFIATPFTMPASDPVVYQSGNGVSGYKVDVATGGSTTPNRALGREITVKAASGGAGTVTLGAPTPVPTSAMRDTRMTIKYINSAAGAVTWAFAAATYLHAGAAVPANTDLHTIVVEYLWDVEVLKWREVCRADSLT